MADLIPCKVVGKKYAVHVVTETADGLLHTMKDYPVGSRYDATPAEVASMVHRLVPIEAPPEPPEAPRTPAAAKKGAA